MLRKRQILGSRILSIICIALMIYPALLLNAPNAYAGTLPVLSFKDDEYTVVIIDEVEDISGNEVNNEITRVRVGSISTDGLEELIRLGMIIEEDNTWEIYNLHPEEFLICKDMENNLILDPTLARLAIFTYDQWREETGLDDLESYREEAINAALMADTRKIMLGITVLQGFLAGFCAELTLMLITGGSSATVTSAQLLAIIQKEATSFIIGSTIDSIANFRFEGKKYGRTTEIELLEEYRRICERRVEINERIRSSSWNEPRLSETLDIRLAEQWFECFRNNVSDLDHVIWDVGDQTADVIIEYLESLTFKMLEEAVAAKLSTIIDGHQDAINSGIYEYTSKGGIEYLDKVKKLDKLTPMLFFFQKHMNGLFVAGKGFYTVATYLEEEQGSSRLTEAFHKFDDDMCSDIELFYQRTERSFNKNRMQFYESFLESIYRSEKITSIIAHEGSLCGEIDLTWESPESYMSDISHYQIFYSENSDFSGQKQIHRNPDTQPPPPGSIQNLTLYLEPGEPYWFKIYSINWDGLSSVESDIIGPIPARDCDMPFAIFDAAVNPSFGSSTIDRYTFSVRYKHKDNQAPDTFELVLDGAPHPMVHVGSNYSDTLYQYTHVGSFPSGSSHEYYFNFSWRAFSQRIPATHYSLGIDLILSKGEVDPPIADTVTVHEYSVHYRHPQGKNPTKAILWAKGGSSFFPYEMGLVSGDKDNGSRYVVRKYCSAGNDEFYFEFSDGANTFYDPPDALSGNYHQGPTIPVINDMSLQRVRVEPENLEGGDFAALIFEVKNSGTVLESGLPVKGYADAVQLEPLDATTGTVGAGGVVGDFAFSWAVPLSDTEETYNITAEVGTAPGETNTTNNTEIIIVTVQPPPGSISGYVEDEFANYVDGATVKITSNDLDIGSSETDEYGYYKIDGLAPGIYSLKAEKLGLGQDTAIASVGPKQDTPENFMLTGYDEVRVTDHDPETESLAYTSLPTWSPDGTKIAYAFKPAGSSSYGIYVADSDGSGTPSPLEKPLPNNSMGAPAWAPDNSGIAYDCVEDIYINDIDGSNPRLIIANAERPSWSPDASMICYVNTADTSDMWIASGPNWTNRQKLIDEYLQFVEWSPDGTMIASRPYIYAVDYGPPITMTPIKQFSGAYPSWLPDSSGIVFDTQFETGNDDVALLRLDDDTPIRLSYTTYPETHTRLSPDGTMLAFRSHKDMPSLGKYWEIYNRSFSVPEIYFKDVVVSADPFTPNGDGVDDTCITSFELNSDSYVTAKIYDWSLNLVKTIQQDELMAAGANQVVWDGTDNEGLRKDTGVYFLRLDEHDGAENHAITVTERVSLAASVSEVIHGISPQWSSDDSKLAVIGNGISITTLSTMETTSLPLDDIHGSFGMDWSSDDSRFTYRTGDGQLKIVDDTGSEVCSAPVRNPTQQGTQQSFNSDGSKVVYGSAINEGTDNYDIFTRDNDCVNNEQRLTTDSYDDMTPEYSPDGATIAFESTRNGSIIMNDSRSPDIWLMNSDGSNQRQLTFDPLNSEFNPSFTPDGSRVIFSSDRNTPMRRYDIWITNADGSNLQRLIKDGWIGSVSHDGRFIASHPLHEGFTASDSTRIIGFFNALTKGTIRGQVVDSNEGAPVSGTGVYAMQGEAVMGMGLTSYNGSYQIPNLDPGDYNVVAIENHYVDSAPVPASVVAGVVTDGIDPVVTPLPYAMIMSPLPDSERSGDLIVESAVADQDATGVTYDYREAAAGGDWTTMGTATDRPFNLPWDTSSLSPGAVTAYEVRATALKAGGLEDNAPDITEVIIDKVAPAAVIDSPSDASPVTTAGATVVASSIDTDIDHIDFEYKLAASSVWEPIGTSYSEPYSAFWDTSGLIQDEIYNLRAKAIDRAGNMDDSPAQISVELVGCGIAVDPSSLDFGTVPKNTCSNETFTITNPGVEQVTVSLSEDCPQATIISPASPIVLDPGENADVTVRFCPTQGMSLDCTIHLSYTAASCSGSLDIPVSGEGLNSPPVADAGDPQDVIEGEFVQLDGSGSYDANGDGLYYDWTQTAGPVVSLPGSNTSTPSFTAPLIDEDATLTFRLVVNDGETDGAPSTVDVTIRNDNDEDGVPDYLDSDDDNDGISDEWEELYPECMDPLVKDAHLDCDGDGYSNYLEYLGGTDPTDELSVPSTITQPFSLITTPTTSVNAISLCLEGTGLVTADDLGAAITGCDLVSKWDAATQSYYSHVPSVPDGRNFDLVVGEAYFASVIDDTTFELIGLIPESLSFNLITTSTTSVNAISLPYGTSITTADELGAAIPGCDLVSKWDATTQSYYSHVPGVPDGRNFDVYPGEAYFVSVTGNIVWP